MREYVPAYRSGPYALILTLYKQSQVRISRFSGVAKLTFFNQSLNNKLEDIVCCKDQVYS